jgi:UDP-N-acetylglucosamine--N-acetylmuramyl-(pentapeptide) pyrophosphoryl-undecaprenol N-acetylglucosamine transferase
MSGPRIVIAAGGTAGHVVPAIAVADALRAEGADVSFVGGQRAEAELVPAAGYPLDPIKVEGISRSNPLKAARAAGKAALALRQARAILRARRADAVLGGGGYVAGPVGLAAVLGRVPLVLTEADSHMGMSNRLLAGRAHRVCLAFPLPGRAGPRYVVTGRPVPPRDPDRAGARAALGIGAAERCVLVFGGSLGARSLNHAAVAAFADAPYRVLHVAGRRDFPDLTAPGPHYDLRDYLASPGGSSPASGPTPFGQALAAADLAVARAGGSIFELAQYGLPAVLVPYPHATADHQTANARWMEQGGAATVIADAELTPERLRAAVDAIALDDTRFAAMAAASARLARPDAARDVAHAVLEATGPTA